MLCFGKANMGRYPKNRRSFITICRFTEISEITLWNSKTAFIVQAEMKPMTNTMLKTKNCSCETVHRAGEAEDGNEEETHDVKFASSEKPWHKVFIVWRIRCYASPYLACYQSEYLLYNSAIRYSFTWTNRKIALRKNLACLWWSQLNLLAL